MAGPSTRQPPREHGEPEKRHDEDEEERHTPERVGVVREIDDPQDQPDDSQARVTENQGRGEPGRAAGAPPGEPRREQDEATPRGQDPGDECCDVHSALLSDVVSSWWPRQRGAAARSGVRYPSACVSSSATRTPYR